MSKLHVIRTGENLSRIAKRYNMSLSELLALNPSILNPDLIYPGQVLNLSSSPLEEFMTRGGGRPLGSYDTRPVRQVRIDLNELLAARKAWELERLRLYDLVRDYLLLQAMALLTGNIALALSDVAPYLAALFGSAASPALIEALPGILAGIAEWSATHPVAMLLLNAANTAGAIQLLGSENGIEKTAALYDENGASPEFWRSFLGDAVNTAAAVGGISNAARGLDWINRGRYYLSEPLVVTLYPNQLLGTTGGTVGRTYTPPTRSTGLSPRGRGEWRGTSKPSPVKVSGNGPAPASGGPITTTTPAKVKPTITGYPFIPFLPPLPPDTKTPPTEPPTPPILPPPPHYPGALDYGSVETHDGGFERWFMQQNPGDTIVWEGTGLPYIIQHSPDPWRHDVDPRTSKRSSSYLNGEKGEYIYDYTDGRSEDESAWYKSDRVPEEYDRAKASGRYKRRP